MSGTFSEAELAYLRTQRLARLATVGPDGAPQVRPVGFRVDDATGDVVIAGFSMATSQKYRNVRREPRVSLVVDDIASVRPWRVRGVEVRGRAQAVPGPGGPDTAVIRITPDRVRSWGLDAAQD
jgi:pyridoxamine 5'-phosphate oxidase family protein